MSWISIRETYYRGRLLLLLHLSWDVSKTYCIILVVLVFVILVIVVGVITANLRYRFIEFFVGWDNRLAVAKSLSGGRYTVMELEILAGWIVRSRITKRWWKVLLFLILLFVLMRLLSIVGVGCLSFSIKRNGSRFDGCLPLS